MQVPRQHVIFLVATLTLVLVIVYEIKFVGVVSLQTSVVLISRFSDNEQRRNKTELENVRNVKNEDTRQKLKIALYHVHHGMMKNHIRHINMSKCFHYQNCETVLISPLKPRVIDADAVLFQGNNAPRTLPRHRDTEQVFIFATIESPVYLHFTDVGQKKFRNFFNWTMTYRIDSDIPYIYGSIIPKKINKDIFFEEMESDRNFTKFESSISTFSEKELNGYAGTEDKNYSEIFHEKTESALWFVSHCKTASKREDYVNEMMKYTNVTKIGKCNTENSSECPKGENCVSGLTKSHKFYIAFENSLCSDYITEKAFRWFTKDIVIVVRGARHYDKYLPKGTYIDTNDFKSAKDLAQYLNRLAANENEYTTILKLKDQYTVIHELEHVQIAYCNICYKLNNLNVYRKSIANVNDWWSKEECVASTDIE